MAKEPIVSADGRDPALAERLLGIWEGAVRVTHPFLAEGDIAALRPEVRQALGQVRLYVQPERGRILGFLGLSGSHIEMLFVDAAARGKGTGKALVEYAVHQLGASTVDVNVQNVQGVGFYRHMGFRPVGRSKRDSQGRPFPLLHMALPDEQEQGE